MDGAVVMELVNWDVRPSDIQFDLSIRASSNRRGTIQRKEMFDLSNQSSVDFLDGDHTNIKVVVACRSLNLE